MPIVYLESCTSSATITISPRDAPGEKLMGGGGGGGGGVCVCGGGGKDEADG